MIHSIYLSVKIVRYTLKNKSGDAGNEVQP